jgi:hypothetical protein
LPTSDQEADLFDVFMAIDGKGKLGQMINKMSWKFLTIEDEETYFYTSDQPVIRLNHLRGPLLAILFPIGPRNIFIAADSTAVLNNIINIPKRQFIKECNKQVVSAARRYAFSLNDQPKRFFCNNLSKSSSLGLMEQILLRRGNGKPSTW